MLKRVALIFGISMLAGCGGGGGGDAPGEASPGLTASQACTGNMATRLKFSSSAVPLTSTVKVDVLQESDTTDVASGAGLLACVQEDGFCAGDIPVSQVSRGYYTLIASDESGRFLGATAFRIEPDSHCAISTNPIISTETTGFYVGRKLNQLSPLDEEEIRGKLTALTKSEGSIYDFYLGLGQYFVGKGSAISDVRKHEGVFSELLQAIDSGNSPYMKSPAASVSTGNQRALASAETDSTTWPSIAAFGVKNGGEIALSLAEGKYAKAAVAGMTSLFEAFDLFNKPEDPIAQLGPEIISRLDQINSKLDNISATLQDLTSYIKKFEAIYLKNIAQQSASQIFDNSSKINSSYNSLVYVTSFDCAHGNKPFPSQYFIIEYVRRFGASFPSDCAKTGLNKALANLDGIFTNSVEISGDDVAIKGLPNDRLSIFYSSMRQATLKYPDPRNLYNGSPDPSFNQPVMAQQYNIYNSLVAKYSAGIWDSLDKAYLVETSAAYLNSLPKWPNERRKDMNYPLSEMLGNSLNPTYGEQRDKIGTCIGFDGKPVEQPVDPEGKTMHEPLCDLNMIYSYRNGLIKKKVEEYTLDFFNDVDLPPALPGGDWSRYCHFPMDQVGDRRAEKPLVLGYSSYAIDIMCPLTPYSVAPSVWGPSGWDSSGFPACEDIISGKISNISQLYPRDGNIQYCRFNNPVHPDANDKSRRWARFMTIEFMNCRKDPGVAINYYSTTRDGSGADCVRK